MNKMTKKLQLILVSYFNRFNFSFPILRGKPVPIVIDTWNVFNSAGEISMYDATFKWWQWTVDYLLTEAGKTLNATKEQAVAYVQNSLADSICGTAMKYCNGTNVQYNSTENCLNFLTKEIRFGEAYELGALAAFPLPLTLHTFYGVGH